MEKVYLVIVDAVTNCEPSGSTKVFANRKDAEENFKEEVDAAKIDAGEDWVVQEDEVSYETFEEGFYTINRISVILEEKKVN